MPGVKWQHNVFPVSLQAYILATRVLHAGAEPADTAAYALLVTQRKLLNARTNAAPPNADAAQLAGVRAMSSHRLKLSSVFGLLDGGAARHQRVLDESFLAQVEVTNRRHSVFMHYRA